MTLSGSAAGNRARGFDQALRTFKKAASAVPAYQDFLGAHRIEAATVCTAAQFASVPPMTMSDYVHHYPHRERLWCRNIEQVRSWSTGPSPDAGNECWPGGDTAIDESVLRYERLFRQSFASDTRSTLLIRDFSADTLRGMYAWDVFGSLHRYGHRISVLACGLDADAVLTDLTALGPLYDQVVLAGRPLFISRILERAGRDVLCQDIRILVASNHITEEWRDRIRDRIGKSARPEHICMVYGSSGTEIFGYETPLTIAIRRSAWPELQASSDVFGSTTAESTLVEFDPLSLYVEVDRQGYFLVTVDDAAPLIRFRSSSRGNVVVSAELADILRDCGHTALSARAAATDSTFMILTHHCDELRTDNHIAAPIRPDLSDREKQVLLAWLRCENKEEVGQLLHISLGTVHAHLSRIREKYANAGRSAPTKAALVVRALQDGLIGLDKL